MYLMKPEDFEPWVGKAVRVDTQPEQIEVTLTRIKRMPVYPGAHRAPFVLYFECPTEIYLLDMAYTFDCGRGGPYSIHIAQLRPEGNRRVYHAMFN
jgi:hypothetical protein